LETREGMKQILGNNFMNSYVRGWKQAILVSFNLATADARRSGVESCE